jgi:ribosomal protein L11 methyltransferase
MPTSLELVFAPETATDALDRALDAVVALDPDDVELLDEAGPRRLIALFADGAAHALESRARAALTQAGVELASLAATAEDTVDWGSDWRLALRPQAYGPLWVVPAGRAAPADADEVLVLDARGAFGSGRHPTTRMVLERLVELSPARSVLDVGTGTGILALAALRLGAERVVATDVDPTALQRARANAELNGLAERLTLSEAAPEQLGEQFELVVANITAAPLMAMAPRLVRAIGHRGTLLLSGVPLDQADEVARTYRDLGMSRSGGDQQGDWALLELLASW